MRNRRADMGRLLLVVGGLALPLLLPWGAWSQAPPAQSGLTVSVALNRTAYLFTGPPEAIQVTVAVQNVSGGPLIVAKSLTAEVLHRTLTFLDPDGHPIVANDFGAGEHEGPPPPVLLVGDELVQVDPVVVLPPNASFTVTIPDARTFFTFTKPGTYRVTAAVPARIYPAVFRTGEDGTPYAKLETATFGGGLFSNTVEFFLVADADGDGYVFPVPDARISARTVADCHDQNALISPGATEIPNDGLDNDCNPATPDVPVVAPGTIQVLAEQHTVGAGSAPPVNKGPIPTLPVRVYTKAAGGCAAGLGFAPKDFKSIWLSCLPQATAVTSATGQATLALPPGSYLVLGQYDPPGGPAGDEVYPGKNVDGLVSGAGHTVKLKVILKSNGKAAAGQITVLTGTLLEITEPMFVEWDGTQELYPFIFETVGDWQVTTAISPPPGFVANTPSLTTLVNTALKAAQFTITDVGSSWVPTDVTYTIVHKKKTKTVKNKIGVKLTTRLAKEKGLTVWGAPLVAP